MVSTVEVAKKMQVDAILGLMRMARAGDRLIPNLADVVLTMMETLKAFEMRAGLAEAQLEDERAKVAELQMTIQGLCRQSKDQRLAA